MSQKVLNLLQLVVICSILAYIVIHDIIIKKGYLESEYSTLSTSSGKAKIAGTTNTGLPTQRLYDSTDVVYPSSESNAIFITTSIELTPNQRQGICTPPQYQGMPCNVTNKCPSNGYEINPPGQYNGICNISVNQCQLFTWCPMEQNHHSNNDIITNIGNTTIFLDVQLLFPEFDSIVNNVVDVEHNQMPIEGYNLFILDEIIGNATNGSIHTLDIALHGIMILMTIEMDCDLNLPTPCIPIFKYYRIDSEPNTISRGFNIRTASYYNSSENRDLMKRYGARIIFYAFGTATKSSVAMISFRIGVAIFVLIASFIISYGILKWIAISSKTKKKDKLLEGEIDPITNPSTSNNNNNNNNGKYHKCDKCGKNYKYLCNLRSHAKVHTAEAHVCEYCQKRFGRKENYEEHRKIHSGESPYSCKFCKRSFKQRHGLKDHMRLRCISNNVCISPN